MMGEAAMKRHADKLVLLLALFVLIVFLAHDHARVGNTTAQPTNHVKGSALLPFDRSTKFDLLFGDPDLALP